MPFDGEDYSNNATVTITVIDSIPPEITGILGEFSVNASETVTIWVNATDNIAVTNAKIFIDDNGFIMTQDEVYSASRWNYNYNASSLQSIPSFNPIFYYIEVYDDAGNSNCSNPFEINVSWRVIYDDPIPTESGEPVTPLGDDPPDHFPEITSVSGDVTVIIGETVTLWVETTESSNITQVKVFIDDNEFIMTQDSFSASRWIYNYVADDNNHIYTITIYDISGRSVSSNQYYIWVLDDTGEDASGPTISIRTPSSGSTTYGRTPRIKVVYADLSGIDIDSVTLTVDDIMVTPSFIGPRKVVYIPTTDMSYGEHNIIVEVADTLGNSVVVNWSFTIIESESRSEEEIGDVPAGEQTEITTEEGLEGACVDTIDFTPENDLEDVRVIVVKLKGRPEVIREEPERDSIVYEYFDLKITADDRYVEEMNARVRFKVRQEWINKNNIDIESIGLMRYHNNSWQELNTTLLVAFDEYVYFLGETPGFSTFAVVGSTSVTKTYDSDNNKIPLTTIIIIILAIAILLAVILFKARYIYFGEEPPIEKSKKKIKKENK